MAGGHIEDEFRTRLARLDDREASGGRVEVLEAGADDEPQRRVGIARAAESRSRVAEESKQPQFRAQARQLEGVESHGRRRVCFGAGLEGEDSIDRSEVFIDRPSHPDILLHREALSHGTRDSRIWCLPVCSITIPDAR